MLATVVSFTSACSDWIDLEPFTSLSNSQALADVAGNQVALNGAYARMRGIADNVQTYPDLMSDNTILTQVNNGAGVQIHNWLYTSGDGSAEAMFDQMYSVTIALNNILIGIDDLEDGTQAERDAIKGEALLMRAWCHFELVRWFGTPYLQGTPATDLGVPIKVTPELTFPPRNTVQEVYDQVMADLDEGITLLDGASFNVIRWSAAAGRALRARVNLNMGNYAAAITDATAVIDDTNFELETGMDYMATFADDDSDEIILKARVITLDGGPRIGWTYYFIQQDGSIRQDYSVPEDFFNSFEAGDVRAGLYNVDPDNGLNTIAKYIGRPDAIAGIHDLKLFRISEQYLIRAEAYANNNSEANARTDLNALRGARGLGDIAATVTGQNLINAIVEERRKELAYEGFRWHDLNRLGLPIIRNNAECSAGLSECQLSAGNFRRIFPIPQDEINANAEMVQNDGYGS